MDGKSALTEILRYMDPAREQAILAELEPNTANQIRKMLYTIDVVFQLPDKDLQKVMRDYADRELALVLKGAEEKTRQRLLSSVSERRRELIRLEEDAWARCGSRTWTGRSRISWNTSSCWSRRAKSSSCASAKSSCDPRAPRHRGAPKENDMELVSIADIGKHVDQEVEIRGWLYNMRSKGKIAFLQLRDGTGRIQGVAEEAGCGADAFARIAALKMEASVKVRGKARRDERAPSGFELTVTGVEVVQNPVDDYPISKKEHGIDFLLENRHLWLRSSRPNAIMRIRDQAIISFRSFFHERGFLLIDTPILTGSIGESAGTLFTVPYFDLGDAYLAQTGQLYLEAACMAYGKVFNFGPTFRAEKSKTRRHLTEFWMLEAEVAYADNDDNMRAAGRHGEQGRLRRAARIAPRSSRRWSGTSSRSRR